MTGKKCRICKNGEGNKIYTVRERMLNQGDKFHYLYCPRCDTLQLIDTIEDIGKYYDDYRVFRRSGNIRIQRKRKANLSRNIKAWLYLNFGQVQKIYKAFGLSEFDWMYPLKGIHIGKGSKILDIGCGMGQWLDRLSEMGFNNLCGIDKFAPDITNKYWKFIRGDITDIECEDKYDMITLHHSFEHMQNPEFVLNWIRENLRETGICVIRVPVVNKAWELYGTDWYQIDAPRHYYLYSVKSMKYMCKKAGLKVYKVVFDSTLSQFNISEGYRNTGKSFEEVMYYRQSKAEEYRKKAEKFNREKKGDQAIFYIKCN